MKKFTELDGFCCHIGWGSFYHSSSVPNGGVPNGGVPNGGVPNGGVLVRI